MRHIQAYLDHIAQAARGFPAPQSNRRANSCDSFRCVGSQLDATSLGRSQSHWEAVMHSADDCRRKADEMDRLAAQTAAPLSSLFSELADRWRKLAVQAPSPEMLLRRIGGGRSPED
jgi:hypothetical protein